MQLRYLLKSIIFNHLYKKIVILLEPADPDPWQQTLRYLGNVNVNTKYQVYFKEIVCDNENWIRPAYRMDQWCYFVNMAMNIKVNDVKTVWKYILNKHMFRICLSCCAI